MLSIDLALKEKGEAPPCPETNRLMKKVKIQLGESHFLMPEDAQMEDIANGGGDSGKIEAPPWSEMSHLTDASSQPSE